MQTQKITPSNIVLTSLLVGLGTTAHAQANQVLSYKGSIVSHNVRTIDGHAYVLVADMARLLNGTAVKTSGGYEITSSGGGSSAPAGGANEIKGLAGTVGQMLFTGHWRFEVLSVTHEAQYVTKYQSDQQTVTPKGPNDELVVLDCLVKNARTSKYNLFVSTVHSQDNALTDDQGVAYPVYAFDNAGNGIYGTPDMLPGSAQKYAIIFSIPKGTNLKTAVVSLGALGETFTDVRVTLPPPAAQ